MGKKAVVITGSPRKGGNSFAMVDAFVDAAEKLGHEVTRFDAAFMKIGGCHACETCYSAGKECALIACCEEEDPTVLDGVRVPMERICALNKWDMVGEVLVPGVLNKDGIEKTDACATTGCRASRRTSPV